MFESFYQLNRSSFSLDIPTDELYPSIMLEETLGSLEYAVEPQDFSIVIGDNCTGKTKTFGRQRRRMRRSVRFCTCQTGYKANAPSLWSSSSGVSPSYIVEISKSAARTKIEMKCCILQLQTVVVVDEVPFLDREMLEEVRFLLNFKRYAQKSLGANLGRTMWDRLRLQAYDGYPTC